MAEQYTPNVGNTPASDARRDAIHVAVAPLIAGVRLMTGDRVYKSEKDGKAYHADNTSPAIGIVDPFLEGPYVAKGERFWLFLFPQTITGLRHVWQHPSFKAQLPEAVS